MPVRHLQLAADCGLPGVRLAGNPTAAAAVRAMAGCEGIGPWSAQPTRCDRHHLREHHPHQRRRHRSHRVLRPDHRRLLRHRLLRRPDRGSARPRHPVYPAARPAGRRRARLAGVRPGLDGRLLPFRHAIWSVQRELALHHHRAWCHVESNGDVPVTAVAVSRHEWRSANRSMRSPDDSRVSSSGARCRSFCGRAAHPSCRRGVAARCTTCGDTSCQRRTPVTGGLPWGRGVRRLRGRWGCPGRWGRRSRGPRCTGSRLRSRSRSWGIRCCRR